MPVLVYMTAETPEQARAIGDALIVGRYAACVNILGSATSVFHWQGRVQENEEVALIAKTTEQRLEALVAEVRRIHTYDVPCIVAMPIIGGDNDFLEWIATEVTPSTPVK